MRCLLMTICLITSPAFAADQQPRHPDYQAFEDCKRSGVREKAAIIRQLKSYLRTKRQRYTFTFPDGAWVSGYHFVKPDLPLFKKKLAEIQQIKEYYGSLMDYHDGSIGVLRAYLHIDQILSDDECVITICSKHNFLDEYHICKGKDVIIRNMTTRNLANREVLILPENFLFKVTGSERRRTVLGAIRNLTILEPWDIPAELLQDGREERR